MKATTATTVRAAESYPFTFFDHGKVLSDADAKSAEAYVVFSRETTADERARIAARCPPPLGLVTWAARFVYVASPGDDFDFLVLAAHGGTHCARLLADGRVDDALDKLPRALKAFAAAYDAWLIEAHALVPIAFTAAPTPTALDAWGRWSRPRILPALAAMSAIREAPSRRRRDEETKEPMAGALATLDEIAERLAWIESDLQRLAAAAPVDADDVGVRIAEATRALESLEIPVDHVGTTIGTQLADAGGGLAKALKKLKKAERRGALVALSPRARLAYAASTAARRNRDLEAYGDLPTVLDALVDAWPPRDRWRAASLVADVALGLAALHFDPPDPDASRAALPIMKKALARGARTITCFSRAIDMARIAGDAGEVVALGEQAVEATGDPSLADQAAKAARALGDAPGAKALAQRHAAQRASSAAAQSADLTRCEAHLEQGGAFTIDLLANTAVLYRRQDSPDPAKIAAHVERMRGLLLREVAYGFGAGPSFAVMACVHGHADEAIDVLDELLDRGLWQNPDVLWTLADAGHRSRDVERKRRVVARVTSLLPSSESPFARAHLARIHAALGDPASAIATLAPARASHPRFAELRDDEALRPLRGQPAFEALFASHGARV